MKWAWFKTIGTWIGKALVKWGPTIADVVISEKNKKRAKAEDKTRVPFR